MTEIMQAPCNRTRTFRALLGPVFVLAGCGGFEPTATLNPNQAPVSISAAALDVADPGRVVISQVYGGGGNSGAPFTHDFVELYNAGGTSVSLSGWSVQYASAMGTGHFAANGVVALSGSLAPGQYYLVRQATQNASVGAALPTPDATGSVNMSGSAGKVIVANTTTGLACNGGSTPCAAAQHAQIVDLVGYGNANFFEGSGAAPTLSNTTAAHRKNSGAQDTDNNANDFVAGAPTPRNSSNGAPAVATTTPPSGATDVARNANVVVTFNKPVDVADGWFSITCGEGVAHTATQSNTDATTFTLDPDADFAAGQTCMTTILASKVTDRADASIRMRTDYVWSFTTAAANPCELPYTAVYRIQGDAGATPLAGQTVTTQGVIVGDYEGPSPALRGFYLQDSAGDDDAATSDGIFVFNQNNDNVKPGDVVRVTGTAEEFQGQTQIGDVTSVRVCGSGAAVAPVDVTLPFSSATFPERYEGMLVRLPQTLVVTEHFQLGRFGQVVLSFGDRLAQPTSIAAPGDPARAIQAQNDLNRIIVDDARNDQNPDPILFARGGNPLSAMNTLRGGDAATGIVGVMTYTWAGNAASGNAYRVRPVNALGGGVPNFVAANPRLAPPTVGGTLKVAALNLLNYFNTFGNDNCSNGFGGTPTDCRGAESSNEFDRQWPKTVAAIIGTDADVIAVNELENDGHGPESAIAHLVGKLNEAPESDGYDFIRVDERSGPRLGTDAIKVGLIYKPGSVTPTGVTAVLNSIAFVNGGDGGPRNRPALAQAFIKNSDRSRFAVVVNHLKSKGSGCDTPPTPDGQGECNSVRTNAANRLVEWLRTDPTDTGEPDVLIMGDLNSYAKEDPITALTNGGYTNLIAARVGANAYSFAFDGQWGYLDHALGSASLLPQVVGVAEWHINADEPNVLDYNTNFKSTGQIASLYSADQFRAADHDPVIVGLTLRPPAVTYNFGGFLEPVVNLPALNDVNSGASIPLKFSLGGNRGMNIFARGYPASRRVSCETGAVESGLRATDTPGNSVLQYEAGSDTYHYNWKTEKSWAKTCRELVLRFNDESQRTASFFFSK